MFKKLSYLLPVFLGFHFLLGAMESAQSQSIKIICIDGELDLPKHDAKQFDLFSHLNHDTQARIIELPSEKNIKKADIEILLSSTALDLKKKLIGLNNSEIKKLVQKAEYLGLEKTSLESLIFFVLNAAKNIHDLLDSERSQNMLDTIIIENQNITIKSGGLETLDGLEELLSFTGSQNKWFNPDVIIKLDLSNNKLEKVDLEKIFQVFPHLKEINLKNNQIKTIFLPKKRPLHGCQINISNNPILADQEAIQHLKDACRQLPKSVRGHLQEKLRTQTINLPMVAIAFGLYEGGLSLLPALAKYYTYLHTEHNIPHRAALLPFLFNQFELNAIGRAVLVGVPSFAYLFLLCQYIDRYKEPSINICYDDLAE